MKYIIIILLGLSLLSCKKEELPAPQPQKEIRTVEIGVRGYCNLTIGETPYNLIPFEQNRLILEKGVEIKLEPRFDTGILIDDDVEIFTFGTNGQIVEGRILKGYYITYIIP